MTIVYISLAMLLIGFLMATVGKLWVTYYGFKYSAGLGIGVFLIDFIALWFAFYKLEKEGKEWWISAWLVGIATMGVTLCGFYAPLYDVYTGKAFEPGYAEAHAEGGPAGSSAGNTEALPPVTPPQKMAETPSDNIVPAVDADAGGADAAAEVDGGMAPGEAAPGEAAPGEAAPGEAAPGGDAPAPGGAAPGAEAPAPEGTPAPGGTPAPEGTPAPAGGAQ